ncbi:polyprenyl synthetase family protein [Furfurilactobacillus entadae]|uniref:polyprenyl synthetase family protein n=1 Tax=Furfurilactobacillus entadae TaxID=2922307 RepID=UPI0035E98EFD
MVHPLWRQFPTVNHQLTQLTAYLPTCVDTSNDAINAQVTALLTNGGKFLRPGFFYLFAGLGPDQEPSRLQSGAAAIELLHVATLIHDDVLDVAEIRHGQPTLQVQNSNKIAIYTGDLLFTSYFAEILKAAETPAQIQAANTVMQAILGGELDQLTVNFDPHVTTTAYLNEIQGKTARLFEFAATFAVELSHGRADLAATAGQIGLAIGTAYQIRDDILDYVADATTATKPVQHDLRQGVYTLPLLLASQQDPDWFKAALADQKHLTDEAVATINNRVHDLHGPELAETVAREYTDHALSLIATLPAPVSDQLTQLTTQLLQRNA